jgi:hypothetical protein
MCFSLYGPCSEVTDEIKSRDCGLHIYIICSYSIHNKSGLDSLNGLTYSGFLWPSSREWRYKEIQSSSVWKYASQLYVMKFFFFNPVCSILLHMYYKYIYDTSLYLLSQHCVYFDISHSLSSQYVLALRAIIKWVTNTKFYILRRLPTQRIRCFSLLQWIITICSC